MPSVPMPQIDQSTCRGWSENDINMYNTYQFFLAKTQVERRKQWSTFGKLTKPRNWKPNMGPIMRGVRTNFSPNIRQFVSPQPLSSQPTVDINNITETKTDSILYWQDFESPALYFLPEFQDFMSHAADFGEDMLQKIERYEELFYRGMMFHMSPFIFIAKGNTMELVPTTPFGGTTVLNPTTDGKSTALLEALITEHGAQMSPLTLASLSNAQIKMSVNLGIPPFSGSGMATGDNKGLDQKYALITHEEAWTRFAFDSYLQQHKNCDLDVVFEDFRGSLFGRITSKLESQPMFLKADGTFPAPETRVMTDDALNQYETVPSEDYTDIGTSPYAISFISGAPGYESITVGPPPGAFTKNTMPHNFPAMQWNGEVNLTKDFLLECVDPATGQVRVKSNSKGRYLRYESTLTLGIFPKQRRSIIPILHKRSQSV